MSGGTRGIGVEGVRFRYRRSAPWPFRGRAGAPVALECASLAIPPGLTLLLGPNGSGKSTLLKLLAGIEMPETGTVTIDGLDLWREEREARLRLAYVPEQPDLSPYATLGEVLRLVAALRGEPASRGAEALARVGLGELTARSIRELSMGQRRRAMLAALLVGETTTLLLDEPLETLDRGMREAVLEVVDARLAAGATALVSTHEIEPFLGRADRAVVVRSGIPTLQPLPDDAETRFARLDAWARGAGEPGRPA